MTIFSIWIYFKNNRSGLVEIRTQDLLRVRETS